MTRGRISRERAPSRAAHNGSEAVEVSMIAQLIKAAAAYARPAEAETWNVLGAKFRLS